MIEGETIFRSTSNEDERRQLFGEYILELRGAAREQEARTRKEAIDHLSDLLRSLDMEPYTRWSEAQTIIQQNEHFQSEDKFQALSKLDVLNTFETHIKNLEREFNDKRQRMKAMKNRKERKRREAFAVCVYLRSAFSWLLTRCSDRVCFMDSVQKVISGLGPSGRKCTL